MLLRSLTCCRLSLIFLSTTAKSAASIFDGGVSFCVTAAGTDIYTVEHSTLNTLEVVLLRRREEIVSDERRREL